MKKRVLIIGALFIIFVAVYLQNGDSKYPKKHPVMTVEYEGETYEAGINELTWFESPNAGSSSISEPELYTAENMNSIVVKAGDTLSFNLSYDKDISEIKAMEVRGLGIKREEIYTEVSDNTIRVTEEKGEHIYSIKVFWDSSSESSHTVSYVIKLNVE